jgi:hypothetical protein
MESGTRPKLWRNRRKVESAGDGDGEGRAKIGNAAGTRLAESRIRQGMGMERASEDMRCHGHGADMGGRGSASVSEKVS